MTTTSRTETHVLVGPRDQVANVLRRVHSTGRLVHIGPAYPAGHNKVCLTIELLPHHRSQPHPCAYHGRVRPVALAAITAVGASALLAWLVYLLVAFITTHLALLFGALTLLAGAAVSLHRPGTHRPGRHH